MAEVFSINGPPDPRQYGRRHGRAPGHYGHRRGQPHPGFGAFGACPAGFATTPNQNCQGPAASMLQNALKALGNTVRDGSLMNLSVDGSIGPATVAAINRVFTVHIGPGQAPPQFRTGKMTVMDVAANATPLTQLINAETTRRGGSTVAPAPAPRSAPSPYVPSPAATPGPAADAPSGFHLSPIAWAGIGVGVLVLGIGVYMFATADSGGAPAAQYEPAGSHVVRAGRGRYAVV